ncbi:MAG TPA: NAD(P)-dependent oxidoreductase [Aestuariivirgaceae bacterium]|nr:NAD(P)-dependent oxidoreductase [Aestuariivirgaceae bacterium]
MRTLKGKTLFVTGASRGIGLAIACRAAADGANVAIAAKTDVPHPKLPGTIFTAAEAVERAGGRALPLVVDIRSDAGVADAVGKAVATFGGIDICINNASAISLSPTLSTEMKRYDLMHDINGRGTFLVSQACLPHLLKSECPHILMISPPLNLVADWFAAHLAYTLAKFEMSLIALGLAAEFRGRVAVNALWPRSTIATAAIANVVGGEDMMRRSRRPEIMADAAHAILTRDLSFTANFCIDDDVLAATGVTDFEKYRVDSSQTLAADFFLTEAEQRKLAGGRS